MNIKKIINKIAIFIGILLVAVITFVYIFFYSTFCIPKGNLYKDISSPQNNYKALVSIVETEELVIRVDIINNNTNRKRLIYWSWHEGDNHQVMWLDEGNISINGTKLNVKKDKYDNRHMSK